MTAEEGSRAKVLITGGAGFIGSWASEVLAEKHPDYLIIIFDRLDYCASLRTVEYLTGKFNNVEFFKGDIRKSSDLHRMLHHYGGSIEFILHFAARSHVDNSYMSPIECLEVNVVGTEVLLEFLRVDQPRLRGIKRFFHISTDEVYGDTTGLSARSEESALAPTNPYSASKASAEMLVHAYAKSYGIPFIITRINNVYGPRQYPEKIIPKFLSLINEKGIQQVKLPIQGSGRHARHYVYVRDTAQAVDLLLHRGKDSNIYNIGTDNEITNLDLAFKILRLYKPFSADDKCLLYQHIQNVQDRPYNDMHYAIDCNKIKREFGWKLKTDFTSGLKETALWYKENSDWWLAPKGDL